MNRETTSSPTLPNGIRHLFGQLALVAFGAAIAAVLIIQPWADSPRSTTSPSFATNRQPADGPAGVASLPMETVRTTYIVDSEALAKALSVVVNSSTTRVLVIADSSLPGLTASAHAVLAANFSGTIVDLRSN